MVKLPLTPQLTTSHCGPAVLQALMAYYGVKVTQEQIVQVVGIERTIADDGMRPRQLWQASRLLAPQLQFYWKQEATWRDLHIMTMCGWPVGINWQGLFYDSIAEELEDLGGEPTSSEQGHYSIVVSVRRDQNEIYIADPFPDFAAKVRVLPLDWFARRWWDRALDVSPNTGQSVLLETKHLIFTLLPRDQRVPPLLDLRSSTPNELLPGMSE